ncbi:MAG: RdgB/HAM1 family non-canonical purine NTP pyrophosphatase [Ignavibacteriaceae bacterium]|jgi:XTP/dITP diphosphohydrolase
MKKIIIASQNEGKVKEVVQILNDLNVEIISLADLNEYIEIIEDGDSFEANALIKAKQVYNKFKLPTIADDSGLVVEQLNGAPGIYSARYADEDGNDKANNKKLLDELKNYPEPHIAKFVCAAVFYNGQELHTEIGEFNGRIIDEEQGTHGFGYDPLFVPDGYSITSAEMKPVIKNSISHRFNAFNNLKKYLINEISN